jgi:hypothetical protein
MEPGVTVKIVVAVMAAAGAKEHPVVARHRESTLFLGHRQYSGLHDDQLVNRHHPVGVARHEPGGVDTRLHDQGRRGSTGWLFYHTDRLLRSESYRFRSEGALA